MVIAMNLMQFVDALNLKYMAQGMGGIFVVICIIYLSILLLQKVFPVEKDN